MKNYLTLHIATLIAGVFFPQIGHSQEIRSAMFNPSGPDDGSEYVEILHTPSTALSNIWLLIIDGDAGEAGNIDLALDLTAYTAGSNGLLLIRDNATELSPAPSAQTSVEINDFSPDIENGTLTFLLVSNFTGAVNDDIDSNNDGTPNTTLPWTTVIDAVSARDNDNANDRLYGAILGGVDMTYANEVAMPPTNDGGPGLIFNSGGVWYQAEVSGSNPGPFTLPDVYTSAAVEESGLAGSTASPGGSTTVLPVILANFKGEYSDGVTMLTWRTLSELNNAYFEVQRSYDAKNFETIGKVEGEGTTQAATDYSFLDEDPSAGLGYYRLKQVDFDGTSTYYSTIVVEAIPEDAGTMNVYPNPLRSGEIVSFDFAAELSGEFVLNLYDISGKRVERAGITTATGRQTFRLSTESLDPGFYIYIANVQGRLSSGRLVIR